MKISNAARSNKKLLPADTGRIVCSTLEVYQPPTPVRGRQLTGVIYIGPGIRLEFASRRALAELAATLRAVVVVRGWILRLAA
jgi:hypothetical protein